MVYEKEILFLNDQNFYYISICIVFVFCIESSVLENILMGNVTTETKMIKNVSHTSRLHVCNVGFASGTLATCLKFCLVFVNFRKNVICWTGV